MTSPMHARKAKLKHHLVSAKAKLKHHLVSAKAKLKHHLTPRRIFLAAAASVAAFLLLLTLRTLSAASPHARAGSRVGVDCGGGGKLPAAVAEALVHYATANATTKMAAAEAEEVAAAARVLARRAPCNLLVFGLGPDAGLWAALNHGGRTLFLEEDAARIAAAAARHRGLALQARRIATSAEADPGELLALRDSPDCTAAAAPLSPEHFDRSPCRLALRGLPPEFYEAEWDVVMVGAPAGWEPEFTGRMGGAIYTAGVAARARRPETGETDVVVHDVEDGFSAAFLCQGYLKEEIGRLRHFAIPSHGDKEGTPFCPREDDTAHTRYIH